MESLSDIETELRTLSKSSRYCELQPTVFRKPISFYFAEIADRIKAAAPTTEKSSAVGNAAAMREACVNIVEYAQAAKCNTEDGHILGFLDQIEKWANAALSKPPRNCDRFNNERKMQFAFLAELISMGINGASLEEYSKWLLAEAKGASDESK